MFSVAVGGVVFGLLREWRGSLVAPITAHCPHNAFISIVQIVALNALE